MKSFLLFGQVVLSIVIISFGCNHVSKPSDLFLVLGICEIIVGILLIYRPVKTFIKQI